MLTGAKVMVDGAESSEGTSNSSKSAPVLQKEVRGVAAEHPRANTHTHTHTLLPVADLKQYALILTSMREFVLFAIPNRGSLEQALVEIL